MRKALRKIHNGEALKRGCRYCADSVKKDGKIRRCIHEECPYHELDEFKTYHDYLKHTALDDDVFKFLKAWE